MTGERHHNHEPEQGKGESGDVRMPLVDQRVFALLLDRIEHLSRELGRAEGRRMALEEQLARLEEQVARLERR